MKARTNAERLRRYKLIEKAMQAKEPGSPYDDIEQRRASDIVNDIYYGRVGRFFSL